MVNFEGLQIPCIRVTFTTDCGYCLTEGKPLAEAWAHYVPGEVWIGVWVPLHCVCEYLLCGWDSGYSSWWSGDWTGDQHQGKNRHTSTFITLVIFFHFSLFFLLMQVAQVAAKTLGIPLEMVKVKPSNTLTNPNGQTTGGSTTSEMNCLVS